MIDPTILIGNKNYSSWSLRAWLALKHTGVAFAEIVVPLYRPETKAEILKTSPSGKVPALVCGGRVVWESLAICEYLAEAFPDCRLWPQDAAARAVARSVGAEMHAGFMALRANLPMNIRARFPDRPISPEMQADIDRIAAIWRDCRSRFGGGGDFLFGHFTIADAMYAPIASRFHTYAIRLDPVAEAYGAALLALPAMQEWSAAARDEPWINKAFEF